MSRAQTPATPASEAARPRRADALRNRAKVLAAAEAQFAEDGLDAQVEEIARAAGVGVGTVYRHFPTKEALLEALAERRFESKAQAAREGLELDDPWEGFAHMMRGAGKVAADDRAVSEAMEQRPGICAAAAQRAGLDKLVVEVVERAQAAGVLRDDVTPEDVPSLLCGLGRAVHADHPGAPAMSWDRYLEIMLAGLRTEPARDGG